MGSCEPWPCCRRQGTAGGLTLCWSPRSTLTNAQSGKTSLRLASKGEGDPIPTFPFLTVTGSWHIPECSSQGHTRAGCAFLHVCGECSIPPPMNLFPVQQGLVKHHPRQERRTCSSLSSHGRGLHHLHH